MHSKLLSHNGTCPSSIREIHASVSRNSYSHESANCGRQRLWNPRLLPTRPFRSNIPHSLIENDPRKVHADSAFARSHVQLATLEGIVSLALFLPPFNAKLACSVKREVPAASTSLPSTSTKSRLVFPQKLDRVFRGRHSNAAYHTNVAWSLKDFCQVSGSMAGWPARQHRFSG